MGTRYKKLIILSTLAFLILEASGQDLDYNGRKLQYIKINELEKIIHPTDNKLYVINFWATWCPPCVDELPDFQKVAGEFNSSSIKFVMISLDFPSQINNTLIPFLKKNKITLDISVMMDIDYDSWIQKIDKDWQGGIPATLFINSSKKIREFTSGQLTEKDLRKKINGYLKQI
jgi:thiol-disulfide isomerase/thioredoxin